MLWKETGLPPLEPPVVRKMPGRPKKARRKDKDEIEKVGKMSRKGRVMTCGICKSQGHNSRGCPQNPKDSGVNLPLMYMFGLHLFYIYIYVSNVFLS